MIKNFSNNEKRSIKKIILSATMCVGCILIILSVCIFIKWQFSANTNAKNIQSYLNSINEIMPSRQNAVLEEKSDISMPAASIKGKNFIGIINFEKNNISLPVGANYEDKEAFPCKYSGSIYDRTLNIHATSQKGQIDFANEICVSDKITFTDMTGDCYLYKVSNIYLVEDAEQIFNKNNKDLSIIIDKIYSGNYFVIECVAVGY